MGTIVLILLVALTLVSGRVYRQARGYLPTDDAPGAPFAWVLMGVLAVLMGVVDQPLWAATALAASPAVALVFLLWLSEPYTTYRLWRWLRPPPAGMSHHVAPELLRFDPTGTLFTSRSWRCGVSMGREFVVNAVYPDGWADVRYETETHWINNLRVHVTDLFAHANSREIERRLAEEYREKLRVIHREVAREDGKDQLPLI